MTETTGIKALLDLWKNLSAASSSQTLFILCLRRDCAVRRRHLSCGVGHISVVALLPSWLPGRAYIPYCDGVFVSVVIVRFGYSAVENLHPYPSHQYCFYLLPRIAAIPRIVETHLCPLTGCRSQNYFRIALMFFISIVKYSLVFIYALFFYCYMKTVN